MPGSCDSDPSSSPSLISSLRRFRFQNKSKQQLPQEDTTTSENSNNSSCSSQSKITPGKKRVDGPLSQKPSPSSAAYNPLSYRKYENPNDSFLLLQSISSKIQTAFRNNNKESFLDLTLTVEETKKLKDIVLLQSSISVKWAANVTEFSTNKDDTDGNNLLKVKRIFMYELSKYVTDVLNDKFAKNTSVQIENNKKQQPIKTYSRGGGGGKPTGESATLPQSSAVMNTAAASSAAAENQTQVAMDDYEEFCEKEQCLRKMLDAFPGADIMEAQDILVKCDWNLKKAMSEVQNTPLRASRKRGLPGSFMTPSSAAGGNFPNQRSNAPNTSKKFPEEIVLDSSDEEDMNGGRTSQQSNSSNEASNYTVPPAKRARRLISTDSEDESASTSSKSPLSSSVTVSSFPQKPTSSSVQQQPHVLQKHSFSVQKLGSSVQQQLPAGQKSGLSVQPPISQKSSSTAPQQKPILVGQSNSSVVRNSSNQNNAPAGKTVNIPQALSVKPLSSTSSANVSLKSVPTTSSGNVSVKPVPASSSGNVSVKPVPVSSSGNVSVKPIPVASSGNVSVKPVPASSSGNVSVKPVPVSSSGNVSVKHVPVTSSGNVSVKPVPVASVSASPVSISSATANAEKSSSSMPNLPKGLSITQVGSGENSHNKKNEKDVVSMNGSNSAKIPLNSKNSTQFVRIKPLGSNTSSKSASMNASSSDKAVTIPPMGKGMSITSVGPNVSVIPKNVSITPVSIQKSSNENDEETEGSSTEDESSPELNPKKNNQIEANTITTRDVKKTDSAKSSKESNNDSGGKSSAKDKMGRRAENDNSEESVPKMSSGRRKKLHMDYDEDDDDYGNDDIYDSEDSDCEENLTSAHSAVLKFFQEASADELGIIPGCSKKKIEAIVNQRPFTKWLDLVEKLRNGQGLSTDLLNGAKKVLDMRNAITKLMNRCQRISYDMEDLVENLNENKETSSGYVNKQPELLNERMHLTAYQMLGLNWLLLMHNQQVNAILADEMGLGKTVQAIAFLAYLKQIDEEGPHLIVVPSSTLDNWRKELETWWPSVSVICYHGQQESRRELRLQILNDEVDEFDIMITTYNMVTSSAEDRSFFKRLEFNYVVFDEAHMLKNMASQRYMNLMKIKAPRRLLLTGTPLQNNLVELMSLLIFTMPHMFSGKTEQIKQMFSGVSKATGNRNTYEKDRIEHAKRIMKPFVLRRLKRDVLKELPSKRDETRYCPMVEDQAKKYEDLIQKFSAEVQESCEEKDGASSSGAGMMMQLRRAANHPLLLRRFYDDEKLLTMSKLMLKEPTHTQSDPNIIFEDMAVMSDFDLHKLCLQYKSLKSYILPDSAILNSGKFKVLDELLPDLIKEDHRILLFSQFTMVLDIVQEYMDIKDYKYLRLDGHVPVSERQQLIDEFNNDPEILVFLLSTRAGGLGINLTAADTVILHDIDFNPYNDKQAEDRCHRVGQVRDVRVIRLISEKTIEEGILQRAREKLKLEKDIHDEGDNEENDTASVAKLIRDALGLKATKS